MYVAVRQFQVGVGHGVQRGEVHGHLHGCGKSTGVTLHLHGVTCFDFLNQQFLHRCLAAAAATAFPHERCRRRRHRYATASTALNVAFVAAGAHARDLGQQLARHTPSEPSPLCCRRRRRRHPHAGGRHRDRSGAAHETVRAVGRRAWNGGDAPDLHREGRRGTGLYQISNDKRWPRNSRGRDGEYLRAVDRLAPRYSGRGLWLARRRHSSEWSV
mmetsp:Transcript_10531/g.25814  ORF Transcript_10531/g.25814 Transcript_10531/m.25814 type:complete len:215 (+) Transcript_10531:746-1390(+)